MNRTKKFLVLAVAVAGAVGIGAAGWAYWTAGGTGTASASVATLDAPTGVIVPAGPVPSPVDVSWTAPSTGVLPTGYEVERSTDGETWSEACGGPLTATSCSDEDVPDGTYTYRVTAIFASWTGVSDPSDPVVVSNIGPASQIVLSGSTDDLVSGVTRVITATVQDAAGHTIADSSHSVTFTQTGGAGSVSGLATTNASSGVATISVTGVLAGPVSAQATATFDGSPTSSVSLGFSVVHGAASQITLSGLTSDLASGTSRGLTATIQDAAGNTVKTGADATRSVVFTQAGTGSVVGLSGGTNADEGVASLTVTGNVAGPVTARASTTLTSGPAESNTVGFDVTVGAAAQLAFTRQPSSSTGAIAFATQPQVTIQDFGGNTVTSGSSVVTLTITSGAPVEGGPGTLSGCAQGQAAGVVTFSGCSIDTRGSGYRLHAASGPLTPADSDTFDVTTGPAAQLTFSTHPSGTATGGTAFSSQPQVTVRDAGDNPVASTPVSLTVTSGSGGGAGGTLTCTTNPVNSNSSGVATFAGCSINTKSTTPYTLTATSGSLTATSNGITVSAGPAAQLTFSTHPSGTATGGTAFSSQPQVTVRDAGDNPVASTPVSLTVTSGSGGGAGGTLTCTTNPVNSSSSGVATFAGCSINTKSTTPYTLTATSGSLTATSNGITVSAGPAAGITITNASNRDGSIPPVCSGTIGSLVCDAPGGTTGKNRLFKATVTLVDRGGNIVANASGSAISVSVTDSDETDHSLQIANGATSTSGQFTVDLANGNSSGTYTATATVGGNSVTVSGTVN